MDSTSSALKEGIKQGDSKDAIDLNAARLGARKFSSWLQRCTWCGGAAAAS